MRILIISEVLHPDTVGGAGRVAAEEAAHLAALGNEVRIITRMTQSATAGFEERAGFSIYRFKLDRSNPIAAFRSTREGIAEAGARATTGWRPNLIYIHQPLAGFHTIKDPALKGLPCVYTFHSSWSDEMKIRGGAFRFLAPAGRKIEREVIRSAARVICLSEFSRRLVLEIQPDAAIAIIPGGVDPEKFPLRPTGPAANANKVPTLLTIRNLVQRMGIGNLIEACAILNRRGMKFKLRIGGRGPLEKKLRDQASAARIDCDFLGRIGEEELAAQYQQADLFVLPSYAIEGFGLVILEAFSCGTPVIGTPVGAIAELVGLQGSGYVSSGPEPESIADAIQYFLERSDRVDPAKLREIAESHTWRARAEKLKALFEEEIRHATRGA